MKEPFSSDLAGDWARIHFVINRGLETVSKSSKIFAERESIDEDQLGGFITYTRTLLALIESHIIAEDEMGFPLLMDKMDELPFRQFREEHQQLHPLVEQARIAIEDIAQKIHFQVSLPALHGILNQIIEIWQPHAQAEDEFFSNSSMIELFSEEEQVQIGQAVSNRSMQYSGPDFLMVPFVYFNLPATERLVLARLLPAVITQEYIPNVWKEKWVPMAPFLLP